MSSAGTTPDQLTLWWLPVGAGGHVVVHTSRWWELFRAWRERREPKPLFHAGLEIVSDGERYTIEMVPAWAGPRGTRGVVRTGPVGLRALGISRFFRYEIRCWRDGIIPDLRWGTSVAVRSTTQQRRQILTHTRTVPAHVWGRDVLNVGDMWNSNSLISWLLQSSGVDAECFAPPGDGRAPGWMTGVRAA